MAQLAHPRRTEVLTKAHVAGIEREQPALGPVVTMEGMKLVKRPITRITFLILVLAVAAIVVIAYVSIHASSVGPNERAARLHNFLWPTGITRSFEITGFLGQILLATVAASLVGSDYSWGVIRLLVSTGAGRSKLLAAKLIALTATTVIYLVAAAAAGSLTSLVVTAASGHAVTLGTVNASWWGDLGLMLVRSAFALWVIVVLTFSIASLTRSVAAGIAVGIGWPFLERILAAVLGLLGNVGDTISKGLITTNTMALTTRDGLGPRSVPTGIPGAWQAFGILVLYCVILLVLAFSVFRRRDIASGS